MPALSVFFQLLIAHAVADFVLQPGVMSSGKSRHSKLHDERGENFPHWSYWLSAHALTHAGLVILVTGSTVLGLVEFFSHFLIDFSKCEKWLSFNQDQILHILFKTAYCYYLFGFIA